MSVYCHAELSAKENRTEPFFGRIGLNRTDPGRIRPINYNKQKKSLKVRQKLGTRKKFENSKIKMAQVDSEDVLNNFCFHVYAQSEYL